MSEEQAIVVEPISEEVLESREPEPNGNYPTFVAPYTRQEAKVLVQILSRADVPGSKDKVLVGQLQAKWESQLAQTEDKGAEKDGS